MGGDTAIHRREVDLIEYYDRKPSYYSPLAHSRYFQHLTKALDHPPDLRNVLDLGCGDGRLLNNIDPAGYTGVDYSPVRVNKAAGLFPERRFLCVDLYEYLDTVQDHYTLTVAVEVLEHLEHPTRVVDAALQVSDVVIGTVPVNMPNYAHLQVYETVEDVFDQLDPSRVVQLGRHWGILWEK